GPERDEPGHLRPDPAPDAAAGVALRGGGGRPGLAPAGLEVVAETALQLLLNGVFVGLTLSLIASGLSLVYGVMNIVNFAHGEFLMLAMYATLVLYQRAGLDPLAALPLTVLLLFGLGRLTYGALVRRVLGAPAHAQIFGTFGLMIALQGAAQFVWGADYYAIPTSSVAGRLVLGRLVVGLPQLAAGLGALGGMVALWLLLERTRLGR